MDEDNLTRQADEIEALSSIYGDEWCVIDQSTRCYCIKIKPEGGSRKCHLSLQVTFPPEYPSSSPPEYQLNATWLIGMDKIVLGNSLEEIFIENMGESIIYMWVEKIREFVTAFSSKSPTDSGGATPSPSHSSLTDANQNTDDFDPSTVHWDKDSFKHRHATDETQGFETPEIFTADTISDRKSTFQPFVAAVSSVEQVDSVLDKLKENKKIANATHNIFAYRISKEPEGTFLQGCEDDGEIHAGSRLLHLLQIVDARDVIVIVTRWYGGIHLGPDRFKHISNCARQVLEKQGYITSNKDDKKSSKGKKGKNS